MKNVYLSFVFIQLQALAMTIALCYVSAWYWCFTLIAQLYAIFRTWQAIIAADQQQKNIDAFFAKLEGHNKQIEQLKKDIIKKEANNINGKELKIVEPGLN